MSKRISVVICSYNYGRFLGECLSSVIEQTRPADEIIVVDDGSTDETEDVVAQFPIVRFIKQDHAGKAAAFNRGIADSTGDIICHLDADDYWYPTKLEKIALAFDRFSVGAVTHGVTHVDFEGNLLSSQVTQTEPILPTTLLTFEETILAWLFHKPVNIKARNAGISNSISVRRGAIVDLVPFPSEINLTVDAALVFIAARQGLACVNEYLSAYRMHGANYFFGQKNSGLDRICLFEWLGGLTKERSIDQSNLFGILLNETKAHFAMDTGQRILAGLSSALLLTPALLERFLVPSWKHLLLPLACIVQLGRVRRFLRSAKDAQLVG